MKIRKQVISIAIIFALSFSAVFTQAFANGESTAPDPVEQFVTRLYELVLQRAPDLEGLNAWSNQLRTNRLTGSRVAYEFFFSPEMKGRNLSDSAFVDVLYNTLLNRAPDASGKNNWTGQLSDGMPRENIFAGFVNSVEFADICNSYGITRGTYEPPPGALSRVFVARLYRTILLRTPDSNGLDGWQNALNNGIVTGAEVAYGFFYSGEMFSKSVNMNDDQFVEILYNSLLGRASDPSGKAYWINQLRSGISRYSLFVGFAHSPEFNQICANYGVTRGTVPQPTNMLQGSGSLAKVWNLIIISQFTGISDRPEHIAGIIGNLQCEAGTTLCPFQQEVSNGVGIGIMQWSWGRRTNMENFLWENGVSRDEFYAQIDKHTNRVCGDINVHPQSLYDRVLDLQVRYMFYELLNTSERLYMSYVDYPINMDGIDGARSYAELFCSIVLRPGVGWGEDNNIQDEGVQEALRASPYVGGAGNLDRISYSNLVTRRLRAEQAYNQYLFYHR